MNSGANRKVVVLDDCLIFSGDNLGEKSRVGGLAVLRRPTIILRPGVTRPREEVMSRDSTLRLRAEHSRCSIFCQGG